MKKFARNFAILLVVLLLPFCFVACDTTSPNTAGTDLQRAVNLATRSCVVIETSGASNIINATVGSAGSGVICRISGNDLYIITNWHVICKNVGVTEPANTIYISPANVKTWEGNDGAPSFQTLPEYQVRASVIGGSVMYDIAIVKATVPAGYVDRFALTAAAYDPMAAAAYGQTVFAVGNALGLGLAASEGIISSPGGSEYRLGTDLYGGDNGVLRRLIRTTAAMQQGNSGGGLFNARGELVGITQSKIMYYGYTEGDPEASGNPADNVAFAVPIAVAGRIADQILARYDSGAIVDSATDKDNLIVPNLGVKLKGKNLVTIVDGDGLNHYLEDVTVLAVTKPSGLGLAVGDIIVSATGHGKTVKVTNTYVLEEFLLECWPQTDLTLTIRRNGQNLILTGNVAA